MAIILDDDLIAYANHFKFGTSTTYGIATEWLIREMDRVILTHIENLPTKCRKVTQVLWIAAPLHVNFGNNDYRKKVNTALEDFVAPQKSMKLLKLTKGWDYHDLGLVTDRG